MKVLSIDGGGIRGLIPALVLGEIERRTGRPTATLFDLIAGTSTGGIIASALTRPGADGAPVFTAEQVADLYVAEGPRIFSRSLLKRIESLGGLIDERYDDACLNEVLRRYLGEARLNQCLTDVFITAYDIEGRAAFFFRSSRARTDAAYDFSLFEAARATAAAPTYFEPFAVTDAAGARTYPLIDGGVYAANPALCAFVEVVRLGREPTVLASLGTGAQTDPLAIEDVRGWGQIEWARPLLDVVFDGLDDATDFELDVLAADRYMRLQTALDGASDAFDDASPENLARLTELANELIRERSADIDRLCEILTA